VSGDPVALAEALRAALPDAEPSEVDAGDLDLALRAAGADPADGDLVGRALLEWERMLP